MQTHLDRSRALNSPSIISGFLKNGGFGRAQNTFTFCPNRKLEVSYRRIRPVIEWLSISIFLNTSVEADFIGPGAIFLNIAQSVVVIASSVSYPNIGQSYSPFRGRVL